MGSDQTEYEQQQIEMMGLLSIKSYDQCDADKHPFRQGVCPPGGSLIKLFRQVRDGDHLMFRSPSEIRHTLKVPSPASPHQEPIASSSTAAIRRPNALSSLSGR